MKIPNYTYWDTERPQDRSTVKLKGVDQMMRHEINRIGRSYRYRRITILMVTIITFGVTVTGSLTHYAGQCPHVHNRTSPGILWNVNVCTSLRQSPEKYVTTCREVWRITWNFNRAVVDISYIISKTFLIPFWCTLCVIGFRYSHSRRTWKFFMIFKWLFGCWKN